MKRFFLFSSSTGSTRLKLLVSLLVTLFFSMFTTAPIFAATLPSYGIYTNNTTGYTWMESPNQYEYYQSPDGSPLSSITFTTLNGGIQYYAYWYNSSGVEISSQQVIQYGSTQTTTAPSGAYYFSLQWIAGVGTVQGYLSGVATQDASYTVPEPSPFPSGGLNAPITPLSPIPFNQLLGLTATLVPGTLSISPPTVASSFSPIVLNGQVQNTSATLSNWTVVDSTGSGDGWNVQIQASQFTELAPSTGFATGTSALTLPLGSLSLTGSRSVVASSGSTSVSPSGGPNFAVGNTTIDQSSPAVFLTAESGYGLGTYTVEEPANGLTLAINPSSTKVDETNYPSQPTPYQSIITFAVVSGP